MSVLGFVSDPFDGWSDPYGDVYGFKVFERSFLHRGARKQIEAARDKKPLRSSSQESHDNRWLSGPTNNIGAWYRLAYWFAVASRIAYTKGRTQAGQVLLADANEYLRRASAAANTGVDTKGQEKEILADGARKLKGAGYPAISALVNQQSTRVKFAQELRKSTGAEIAIPDFISKTAQLKTLTGARPWWFWPVVGGVGLIALAVILRPYATIAASKGK